MIYSKIVICFTNNIFDFYFYSLSTSSYSIKPETLKSLSLDKITEDSDYKNDMSEDNKANKSNEQISIFQMDRDDESKKENLLIEYNYKF